MKHQAKYSTQNFIYFSFIVLLFSCTNKTENDLKKEKLLGDVRTVKEEKFNILNEGKKAIEVLTDELFSVFNAGGFNTELIVRGDKYKYNLKRTFNNENINIAQIWESPDNINIVDSLFYQNNKLVEKRIYIKSLNLIGKEIYFYAEEENTTQVTSYNEKGEVIEKTKSTFDTEGNEIQIEIFNGNNVLISRKTLKYDNHGNEIELSIHDSNNKLIQKEISVYNERDFIIEWNILNS